MNKEIKEILDYLRKYIDNEETGEIIESKHTMNLLLDYITNLQTIEQQYSAILSENAELENKSNNLEDRINKAIEYIENNSYIAPIEEISLFTMNSNPQDLLNILKKVGSDNE